MALLPPDPVYTIRNVDNTPVYSLAFSFLPGGLERLLVGSKNGYVYAYNLQTNRLQQKIEIGKEPILHIVHTDYNLIAQEKGGQYTVWFLTDKGYQKQVTINTDYPGFCRFAFNKYLDLIYLPMSESVVQIYNIKGENLGTYTPDTTDKLGDPMCLQYVNYSAEKQFLLVGYEIGILYLWDLETGKQISKLETKPCPLSVDFHVGQQRGMCGNTTDCIQIFSITKTDFQLEHKSYITIKNPGINRVQSRLDGKVFASAGWDGHIRIFSWFSLRPLAVLTEHKKAVQDIVYSSQPVSFWKNNIMAAGGQDGAITLWNLYNQKN